MSGTKKTIGAMTVAIAAFGGVVLLGTAASAAMTGIGQSSPQSSRLTADAGGVSVLDMNVSAAEVLVQFDDVEQVELRIDGGPSSDWTLKREGRRLEVHGPDRGFDWWSPDWLRSHVRATLVLPRQLRGVDADFSLQAGALDIDGEFDDLTLEVSAGALTVRGDARRLDADVSAGQAEVALSGVEKAAYSVSAGRMVSVLSDAPTDVTLSVSAGGFDLTLPEMAYDVTQQVSAGELDNRLETSRDSDHRISATVSAGSATLRPDTADR